MSVPRRPVSLVRRQGTSVVRSFGLWAILAWALCVALPAQAQLYLRATGVPSSTLSSTAPTATTLPNYDPARDSTAGLLVIKGGSGVNETDPTKYQRWLTAATGVTLSGTLELRLWSAMKEFATDKKGVLNAYLRDCNGGGNSCSLIASATRTQDPWGGGSATWVEHTLSFGSVNYTVAANRTLELKLIVDNSGGDDMMFAYDTTTYTSALGGPAAAIDHYELALATTGVSCLSTAVTVSACTNSSNPCTSLATTQSGKTATLATSAGTLAATTVTFNASGVASTTLSHAAASNGATATVTLSAEQTAATNSRKCCANGTTCSTANSCAITFNTAGFIIAGSSGGGVVTLPTQTAATASGTYYLRAVKTSTTTQACEPAISGSSSVNWGYQCNNPTSCSSGNRVSLTGAATVAVAGNPNGVSSSSSAVSMTFDANGNAPFSFNYSDVGQITLFATKSASGSLLTALSGSSNAFVAKPAGFTLSGLAQTASPFLANPAAGSAAGGKFVKAGESFSVSVTAVGSTGATTPNFGRETSAEGVLLTPSLVLPAGGAAGTLSNATLAGGSFSSGVAAVTNLAWNEVGILTLTPSVADGSYLGAGAVSGTTSGNIGRFIPDHFSITAGTAVPACSAAFTYFGQDGLTTPFTLKAENASNAVTQNYSGAFAKLALTAWSGFVFSASGLPAGSVLAAGATAPSGNWSLGQASITAVHQIGRPSALSGEFGATVRAAPLDSDGVTVSATAVASATPLRYGRLRVSNAFGSASSGLQVPVVAEYWGGNAWVLSGSDSCTAVAAASVALSNPRSATGAVSAASSSASALSLTAGSGSLTLSAPTPAGSSLSLDLALNLGSTAADQSCLSSHPASTGAAKPWLRAINGSCAATADRDPAARVSFGVYAPATRKTVHARELY